MTIAHSGSTKKFAEGWDRVFGGKRAKRPAAATAPAGVKKKTASPKKKAPAKAAKKSAPAKKASRK